MKTETLKIKVNDGDPVTALLYPAVKEKRDGVTIVLGHGAGANQLSGFMRMVAAAMAARGLDAMTFNFLYSERGRKIPDPKARLEACYQAVIEAARKHRKLKTNRLVIGGKSMGGRIASQVAAAGTEGVDGLVFLGYPLHPPGRPETPLPQACIVQRDWTLPRSLDTRARRKRTADRWSNDAESDDWERRPR